MRRTRIAYMPLVTYPEAVEDAAIHATAALAAALCSRLAVTTFAVDIPRMSSGLGSFLIDIPGMVQASEERSKAECHRLQELVREREQPHLDVHCTIRKVALGTVLDAAAVEARYFDVTLVPWTGETVAAQDLSQAVVFGSGRPAIMVPPSARPDALDHIAIAWDASRVAARALGDALPLLAEGGRISVLTVQDEKALSGADIARVLASWLQERGFDATALPVTLSKRTIAEALQETAISSGAKLLAMGGFGHSRIRDFVLGGATKGVLAEVRLPVLLSH